MREKTTDWNLTDELLQMNMFMVFLSPLLTRVERNTESFKIMLRYFHFSAIKGVWPLYSSPAPANKSSNIRILFSE